MGRHARVAELTDVARAWREEGASGRGCVTVADLGTGRGRTVRELLGQAGRLGVPVRVHAVDTASDLDDDVLHDERVRSVLADLDSALPFEDASLDRVISLNVAEHLDDPAAQLAECLRVLRPGGLLVLAHSDWDTVLMTSEDDGLTRLLVDRFVSLVPAWAERSDGFMGRKLLGLAAGSGFELVTVETWADCHRRLDEESVAWKVAMGILTAASDDEELLERVRAWVAGLRRLATEGRFLFTVTDVALVLRRPAGAGHPDG